MPAIEDRRNAKRRGATSWEWEQIERDWLCDSRLAASPATVVDGFNSVDQAFGREWILSTWPGQNPQDAVSVVALGQAIAALRGVSLPGSRCCGAASNRHRTPAWGLLPCSPVPSDSLPTVWT